MRKKRRAYRPARRRTVNAGAGAAAAPRTRSRVRAEEGMPLSLNALRVVVCGGVFVVLVALKLAFPGKMTAVRGTLNAWLVRDADFTEAFSAVGHAVSGEDGALNALQSAYAAVFGGEDAPAAEVSGSAEVTAEEMPTASSTEEKASATDADTLPSRPYPAHTDAAQHVLGFDYAPPLTGEVTSGFGWREDPNTGRETFHYGVDLAVPEGTEIDCFADGTVGVVAESVELGKYLTVHHANGVMTLYGHCNRITAVSGEPVRRGDKLAEAGSTGNATGPHLHFEIHDGETYLDPAYYC